MIEAYRANPVVEKTDTVAETYATSRSPGEAFRKIVDWRTMAVTVAVCALASMVLFGGTFLLAGGSFFGAVASNAINVGLGSVGVTGLGSALGIGAGAGAAMGVGFGIAYPTIFASFTKHAADLLSGKMVRGKSGFAHIKTVPEIEREAAHNRAISEAKPQAIPLNKLRVATDETPSAIPTAQIREITGNERLAELQQQLSA